MKTYIIEDFLLSYAETKCPESYGLVKLLRKSKRKAGSNTTANEKLSDDERKQYYDRVEGKGGIYFAIPKERLPALPLNELKKRSTYEPGWAELFNEIEVSTEIKFPSTISFDYENILANGGKTMTRVYHSKKNTMMYVNGSSSKLCSMRKSSSYEKITLDEIVVRYDMPSNETSTKVKFLQRSFIVNDEICIKQTASIETTIDSDIEWSGNEAVANFQREFVYWFVSMGRDPGNDQRFTFRIAFRRKLNTNQNWSMNIECEDDIPLDLFIDCTYVLYHYYHFQCTTQHGRILAKTENNTTFRRYVEKYLTFDQKLVLDSLEFNVPQDNYENEFVTRVIPRNVLAFCSYINVNALLVSRIINDYKTSNHTFSIGDETFEGLLISKISTAPASIAISNPEADTFDDTPNIDMTTDTV